MFATTLLPSLSVHGGRASVKDVCGWAAVDDALWEQFAGHLGDVSLQNISLLASMQPADIQEAIMATSTGAVGRTKLRLVYATARYKFGLDPIDVGAPLPAPTVPEVKAVSRGEGGSSLKIKVSSVFDQASDREVERVSLEILRKLRARFRAVEGEDPMKTEEVTDDQLSVVHWLTQAGISPYADFGVWRPFGQRAAKSLKFVSHFLDNTGSWRCKEIPGPDSIVTWEACWRVFRTAAIMCDLAAPAVLDRYAAAFRARLERLQDSWHLCVLADTRCRAEHWEAEQRRQALFHDSNPELSAYVPERPWNSVIRESSQDRDFWKEELEDKVADYRNVSRLVHKASASSSHAGDGRNRSRSPKGPTKKQRGRDGGDHPLRGGDGRYRTTPAGKQICFEFNRNVGGCAMIARPSERTCVSFVWNRIAQWSVLVTWGGRLPKVRVRGSTRASGEFVRCAPAKVPSDHWTQVWSQ